MWQDIHASLSAYELTNLALNRPATQSSTSVWSTDQNPEIDARVANNGDVISEKYFHTAVEVDPWWQVDLCGLFLVDKIIVYNRHDEKNRLKKFTIIGSDDNRYWFPIYRKTDDGIFGVFAANITERRPVRFVRVRLDGPNCLHFRECQIFGRPANPDGRPLSRLLPGTKLSDLPIESAG